MSLAALLRYRIALLQRINIRKGNFIDGRRVYMVDGNES
jgi:hypothetical protein